jgi:hypothetical protein
MFRRLFQSSNEVGETTKSGSGQGGAAQLAVAVAGFSDQYSGDGSSIAACKTISFEQIYDTAAAKPTRAEYGILKISEMLTSQHLSGMSNETKRASLLMALEAAGVEIEDLLQDAVVRQRALNDYDESQQTWLSGFETAKLEENRRIQMELDRLTSQDLGRIQSNLDEVARAQDDLRNWQKQKQREIQRITEAATCCVPQVAGAAANNGNLANVLERASVTRR